MADYTTPTVIRQTIPNACMTPLERWLLEAIFRSEPDGDGLYFFAEESPNSSIFLETEADAEEFADAIGASREVCPDLCDRVSAEFTEAGLRSRQWVGPELDVDAIGGFEPILQGIVARHRDVLPFVTIEQSFMCSKMRPDGFGGAAIVVFPDRVVGMSTQEWIARQMNGSDPETKITVWVVSTCIPERGAAPCRPFIFATEAQAEACAEEKLRDEWEAAGIDEGEDEPLPYPGNWREAQERLVAFYGDGSWGKWEITSHQVDVHIDLAKTDVAHA